MLHAIDEAPAASSATLPFWAQPIGVPLITGAYFLIHAVIATTLHAALGVDNAIENYNAQSLALSYSAQNPPLYVWILSGIQQVTGPGPAGFAILNYGSLFAAVIALHRVARRAIADPRLQALSAYSYCLLWEIGHESHRMLTHSNVMIVAIAATVLTLLRLAERGSLGRYLALGFWIASGLLSKYAFGAFLAALLVATLAVPRYRRGILDWRIMATVAVAALSIAFLHYASVVSGHSTLGKFVEMLAPPAKAGFIAQVGALLRSCFGYVSPLLPIAAVIFFRRPALRAESSEEQRDLRTLLHILIGVGLGFAVFWALVLGSAQLRPRYFHALLLLLPVLLFARIDCYRWPARTLRAFLSVTAVVSCAIVVEQMLPRFAPSESLFGACRLSIPYDALGRELEARFGKTPTLVGIDPARAGQLRAAVPGARAISLSPARYRPPWRNATPCVLVWLDEGAGFQPITIAHGIDPATVETIEIPWFQPLLSRQRVSRFYLSVLPESSEQCR